MVVASRAPGKRGAKATEVPTIAADIGNGIFKMVTPRGDHISFLASVKRLKAYEIEDARADDQSVVVTLDGVTYMFGNQATQLGGKRLFEIGKAEHTPLAVATAIALSGLDANSPMNIRLLVPDASKSEWKEVANALPDRLREFEAEIGDGEGKKLYLPSIVNVELVSEGKPVWHWAMKTGQIPGNLAHKPLTGVIDMGTGDLTCSVWTQSGTIVRDGGVSFATPAMQKLAANIAAGFAHKTTYTPDRGVILEIIREQGQKPVHERKYVYEEGGQAFPFTDIFLEEVTELNVAILGSLKGDRWTSIWSQLGMVFITGGACELLAPMEAATGGRYRIVRLEYTEPQMTNAALLSAMG